MKRTLVTKAIIYIVKNSFFLTYIQNIFYIILNKRGYYKNLERSKVTGIFELEELAKPIPYYPIELIKDSNYYGHAYWLKKYAKVQKINFAIEHGLYYGSYIPKASFYRTVKQIITFSENRKQVIQARLDKNVLPIGPYIHYSDSFLSESGFKEIKSEYGRILLLIPSHSSSEVKACFDIKSLIKKTIQFKEKYRYDSVFVLMHFRDLVDKEHINSYKESGFQLVCAGQYNDPLFISRLKSIITLADYTVSNMVGTHTGYCIYMNKPHFIFSFDDTIYQSDIFNEVKREMYYIYSFFKDYHPIITTEQKEVVNKYWGVDLIKTRAEIHEILSKYDK